MSRCIPVVGFAVAVGSLLAAPPPGAADAPPAVKAAPTAPPADGWAEFTPPGGGYAVRMPGRPTPVRVLWAPVVYERCTPGGLNYLVTALPGPEATINSLPPETVLALARDGVLETADGRLVAEKAVTLDGRHPGLELLIEVPKDGRFLRGRLYLVGTVFHQALVEGPSAEAVNGPDARRFLDSFRLAPAGAVPDRPTRAAGAPATRQPMAAPDVTGTWVHLTLGGLGRMVMQLNRDGTYVVRVNSGQGDQVADHGRYTYTAGVVFSRSEAPQFRGRQSRVYIGWLGADRATFRVVPDRDPVPPPAGEWEYMTFTRVPAGGRAVPPANPERGPASLDSAACPNRRCTGGWCSKAPGHGGPHQCGTCGWTWY